MLASFVPLGPFTLIAGGALIASPIIIHLINRMRFKRVRWAAMEFLLKAQKRSRRKLIIEQLILLLLRILLIALVAVLLARLIQRPDTEEVSGRVRAVDPEKRTITLAVNATATNPGDEKTFDVAPDAEVFVRHEKAALADVTAKMQATLNLRKSTTVLVKAEDIKTDSPNITRHIILLDDTASMNDRWRDDRGQEIQAIDNARTTVMEHIVDVVKESNDPHEFIIVNLSSPETKNDFGPLQADSRARIEDHVRNRTKALPNHFDLMPALKTAKEIVQDSKDKSVVLHVVSDFRQVDWNDSTKDALSGMFEYFEKASVRVKLHDVASPIREAGEKPAVSSNNLAIIDFRPESRVVVKNMPMEFTVTVANYGVSDRPNVFIRVRVNNELKQDASVNIPLIRAGDKVTARMTFSLTRTAPTDPAQLREGTRKFDGFNLVSASIENENEGLAVDNVRYAYVEVREKLPILLVDNNYLFTGADEKKNPPTKTMESFYLWKLFNDTYLGFDVKVRKAAELDKLNLQNFAAIVLCDIPALSDTAIKKLESYVEGGGGVGFFMGESIRDPKLYNDKLWKSGKGIFPAPLLEVANKSATVEQLNQILKEQIDSWNMKLLVRSDMRSHPAMEKLYSDSRGAKTREYAYERLFNHFDIARYYIVNPKLFRPSDNVQVLLYRANNRSISDFGNDAIALVRKLREVVDEPTRRAALQQRWEQATEPALKASLKQQMDSLKTEMEKYAKYQKTVREYTDTIINKVGSDKNPLYVLVQWVDELLEGPGDEARGIPSMVQMWQFPELKEIYQDFTQFRDKIKFGDPFYIAKQHGKGRVLAYMGAAGAAGSEGDFWSPMNRGGRVFFPPLMKDSLQRYLSSTGGDFFLPLTKPFEFELDPAVNEKDVHVWRAEEVEKPSNDENKIKVTDLNNRPIVGSDAGIVYKFTDGKEPGMYLFEFGLKPTEGMAKKDAPRLDLRALAYNFDGQLESDLLRARADDLKSIARVEKIDTLDAKNLPQKIARETLVTLPTEESDLGMSKSPWLFLGMLLVLVLEQAWAVRLSFHVRNTAGPTIPHPFVRSAA